MSNKATLVLLFEQGDIPTGSNFADLINSSVNLNETTLQTMAGPLSPTELVTARVSGTNAVFTGTMNIGGVTSAKDIYADTVRASAASVALVSATSINVTGDVSAATGTVYASAMRSTNGVLCPPGIVSAAGTTQATAALLTFVVNRGKGISDGQTTGFRPPANRAGLTQYLFNEGASANLWPPVGGTINGLAVDAAFALAASAMVTIVHLTASAMAVK